MWPSLPLQPPKFTPTVVKSSVQKLTWPLKKWSIGDEIFFKCHQDLLEKPLSQSWPASFKRGQLNLECIAMKATTTLQILLLQKSSRTSKSKDHVTHFQRRMELWLDGDIQALLDEGKCIQK